MMACVLALKNAHLSAAYESGRQLFSMESAVAAAESQISDAQYDLAHVKKRDYPNGAQIAGALYARRKNVLVMLANLKDLSERKGNIETAIIALNRDHVRAQGELAEYRSFIANNGPYPDAATAPTKRKLLKPHRFALAPAGFRPPAMTGLKVLVAGAGGALGFEIVRLLRAGGGGCCGKPIKRRALDLDAKTFFPGGRTSAA